MQRPLVWYALLAAAALATACGEEEASNTGASSTGAADGSTTTGSSTSGANDGGAAVVASDVPDPCALFTEDLASRLSERALASEAMEGDRVIDTRGCHYELQDSLSIVQLSVSPGVGEELIEDFDPRCDFSGGTQVDGIGDWGCFNMGSGASAIITLTTGTGAYTLGVSGTVTEVDVYKEVAQAVFDELQR